MSYLDFIYKRHSVRKFKNEEVPLGDIQEIITAATHAPSGKNLQNWHFVVVTNKEIIRGIADTIVKKAKAITASIDDEALKTGFLSRIHHATLFTNAPVTILIFAGHYPITGLDILEAGGATREEIHRLAAASPGIQNIGAAVQTLMLAAANMGYGTCWMAGANFAGKEIADFIQFEKEGYHLVAITPLGIPEESELSSPARKPLEEIMTIL